MVPSSGTLWRHWMQTCWVDWLMAAGCKNHMKVADINHCGWNISDGELSIDWDSTENIAAINARVTLSIKGCNCKTGCNMTRCRCKKNQQRSSEGCSCLDCANTEHTAEVVQLMDQESDTDNSDTTDFKPTVKVLICLGSSTESSCDAYAFGSSRAYLIKGKIPTCSARISA